MKYLNELRTQELITNIKTRLAAKQNILQFSTMPTASSSNVGSIVQFVGTTETYTNGYFYKCVENSGSYSWEPQLVQNSSGVEIGTVSDVTSILNGTWEDT